MANTMALEVCKIYLVTIMCQLQLRVIVLPSKELHVYSTFAMLYYIDVAVFVSILLRSKSDLFLCIASVYYTEVQVKDPEL